MYFQYLGCVAEAGMVGHHKRHPLGGASWFRAERQCVGSGCTGGPLNLSFHAVFPITSGYQVCLQFSGSLLEVFVSGAYSSQSECMTIRDGARAMSRVATRW